MLCLTGEAGWARLSAPSEAGATRTLRIALFLREHGRLWQALTDVTRVLSDPAQRLVATLRDRGASFLRDLPEACALGEDGTLAAMAELSAAGLATSDGFAGARLMARALKAKAASSELRHDRSGRWTAPGPATPPIAREAAVEAFASALLARYGVVFRRLLARETNPPTWRELTMVYRRLEARGEIRGGRFVAGVSGEQFALSDGVERLREIRRSAADGRLMAVSAADPLNLTGILTSGERVRAITAHRIVYRDGVALASMEGDYIRPLSDYEPSIAGEVASALAGRRVPPVMSGFVGRLAAS
jgi:ATP-dependent Lhr-like helicase